MANETPDKSIPILVLKRNKVFNKHDIGYCDNTRNHGNREHIHQCHGVSHKFHRQQTNSNTNNNFSSGGDYDFKTESQRNHSRRTFPLCKNGQWSLPSSQTMSSSIFYRLATLCKRQTSVRVSSPTNLYRTSHHPLLYLVFMYLLFSSYFSFYQAVNAAACVTCPAECSCTTDVDNNCVVDCSGRNLLSLPNVTLIDPNVKKLNLSNNQLVDIPENYFKGFEDLDELSLQGNSLTSVSEYSFPTSTSFNISLLDNNWICTCDLSWLQIMINTNGRINVLDNVICASPSSLRNQALETVDLGSVKCASFFISCDRSLTTGESNTVVLWEYTDLETSITDSVRCREQCYNLGYSYAIVHNPDFLCMCSSGYIPENIGTSCNDVCDVSPEPNTVCGREVVKNNVMSACVSLSFGGIRTYSQYEAVNLSVTPDFTVVTNFIWDFNDTTVIVSDQQEVMHKYALAGTYYLTITVTCGRNYNTYSFPITVENPISDVRLQCDEVINMNENINASVDIRRGTQPKLMWTSNKNGTVEYDDTFLQSTGKLFNETHIGYFVEYLPSNLQLAVLECEQTGGMLAVVDRAEITDFLLNDVVDSPATNLFWIGLMIDENMGFTAFHISKQSVSESMYTNWADDEPNVSSSNRCVAFDATDGGKWTVKSCDTNLPFICQYQSPDYAAEPYHYITGTTIFDSTSVGTLSNLTESTPSASGPPLGANKVYTVLFPGMWFNEEGIINSWEFTGPKTTYTTTLKLQLFRPKCILPFQKIRPGCADLNNSYLTCGTSTEYNNCIRRSPTCNYGEQLCPITNTCKSLSLPCSQYAEDHVSTPPNDNVNLKYMLIAEHEVDASLSIDQVYQLILDEGDVVQRDDLIGISFSDPGSVINNIDSSDLPLQCQDTSSSPWRQNALLVQSSSWSVVGTDLNLSTAKWMQSMQCDIRVHYTKESIGSKPTSSFLTPTSPGNYTFTVTAFNHISQSDPSATCRVEVRDIVSNLRLVSPPSSGTTVEGYPIVSIPAGTSQKIILEVEGGGQNVMTKWDGEAVETGLITDCTAEIQELVPDCFLKSSAESSVRITQIDLSRPTDSSLIVATASNGYSSRTITLRVADSETITGLKISPSSTTRILKSIPQVFSANVTTGTNVTYSWVVDDLTQFVYKNQQYNVLFRTEADYVLTVTAQNGLGSVDESITLTVDEMNPLTDLTFVDVPSPFIVQPDTNIQFTAKFLVDENIDYESEWTINNIKTTGPIIQQPHSGDRDPDPDIERVYATVTENGTFSTTGEKEIEITILNDYDSITEVITVDVRSPLDAVFIEMTSVAAVGDDLKFKVTGSPSTYGAVFTYDWGDGSTPLTNSDQAQLTHVYSAPGTYTINMTADNAINALSNTTTIIVYERVTGLNITSDGPTEISYSTVIQLGIATGSASARFSIDFGDPSILSVNNVTITSHTVTYNSLGRYNVSATATNIISTDVEFYEVNVFEVKIADVNTTEECFKTNSIATLQAFMPTDVTTLFDYQWTFEDGSVKDVDSDNQLNHTFTTSGHHNVTVKVTSKLTSKFDEGFVIVCIEDEIGSVAITNSPPTEIGFPTTFNLTSTGGTNTSYTINYGDGTTPEAVTIPVSTMVHTYSGIGNYTVEFVATNLVSEVSDIAFAIVQEAVKGVDVNTSSSYAPHIAKDLEVFYFVTTTSGTDLEYAWDFNDGTTTQNGNNANHTYNTTGTYTISVNVSNLVSSEIFDYKITVKDPVSGASIASPASVVRANASIDFTASVSTGGTSLQYYWKVDPGHNYTLGTASFSYVFTSIANYNISVKIENEVSADYAHITILAADLIEGVTISNDSLINGEYAPRNESIKFEVLLDSGNDISVTTAGSDNAVSNDWTISIGGVVEKVYNDSSVIYHAFEKTGVYIISVNISNGVSSKQADIEVRSIDRVGDISFIVVDGFNGAAVTGEEVIIMALVTQGTDLEFFWDPDAGPYTKVNDSNLTYTYPAHGTYSPFVTVGNILGNKTVVYDLIVQDRITGLAITQENAKVQFYVPLLQRTNFVASITSGTAVTYWWHYIDENGATSDMENSTNTQMNWKFPEVTTYKLIVNASNLVSWDQVNYTVTVVQQITGLDVIADSFLVATNTTVKLNATISLGDNVEFKFFLDNLEISVDSITSHISQLVNLFSVPGTYEIRVEADNNVSSANVTKTLSVRDPLTNLRISGCCGDGMYVALGDNLTFSAVLDSGTDVTYQWTITYESGQQITADGKDIHRVLTETGRTEISLSADNVVTTMIERIYIHLQERCIVNLNVYDPGRTLYTNENITLEINVLKGTNITHEIDWGDLQLTPTVTTEDTAVHIYRIRSDYTITVNSSNEVHWTENTVGVSISKLQCGAPSISFVESSKSNFFRSRTIYVEAQLTTNCSAYEVVYSWNVYKQDDCSTLDSATLQNIALTMNRPLLLVPALTLEVSNYCFEVEIAYQDTYLSAKSAVPVAVLSTPLTVVIIGGTTRFLSRDQPLILDAGYSFDPDIPSDQQKGLTFSWSCNSTTALTEEEYGYLPNAPRTLCEIPSGSETLSAFTIEAGSLEEGVQYDYMVVASKSGKLNSFAVQRVIIVPRTIPTTTIICYSCHMMASYEVSSSFHVGLQGSCDTCSEDDDITYLWEVQRVASDGTATAFELNSETTTTGAESRYLVVKQGALEDSYTYQFKLRISVGEEEGYSNLVLSPNLPPINGTCEMTYNDGNGGPVYVLDTIVSFSCLNWRDDADDTTSPLVYTIVASRQSFTASEDIDDRFILYRGTQESYDAYLPLGHAEYSHIVKINIFVQDQLATATLALTDNIVVIQGPTNNSTISWLYEKTQNDLDRLVRLNDPQDIIHFSAAAITVLNSVSLNASSSGDAEYALRVLTRNKISQAVAAIGNSTLSSTQDVQQVASVLEQCVKFPAEMQDPTTQQFVMTSVNNMVYKLSEFVSKEGQMTFQTATNDVLDILGGLLRVVNYAVYDETTANEVASSIVNSTTNYTEVYRKEIISNLVADINLLINTVLRSKVVGEEPVSFLSPVVSVTSSVTTPATTFKDQVASGVYWQLPSHIFNQLDSNTEIVAVSKVYDQNPFTFGFPPNSLTSNGFANITSRVPSIEFSHRNGTAISFSNLASAEDSNERRVKLSMSQSSWEYMSVENTIQMVNSSGSNYQPGNGLTFETMDSVQPLHSLGITITNNNRDAATAVHVMITYTKLYNNNRAESNPAVEAYFGYSPKPNKENNSFTLRLTDAEMTSGVDHQRYTFFINPEVDDTTVSQFYLNISNYFTYEIVEMKIAVYYSLCLYYDELNDLWASDGLHPSSESTYSVSVCYSDHLTSFGSFVINPPNLLNITDIVNIDFSQNPIALITVVVIMFLYIVGMILARRLDLRDIKRASLIPLCGTNGSFKYEITIKTAAGIGSGTTANVGICVYGYDTRTGSRHLARKDAFQRGAVDTMQIASDVSLGEVYKIKIWHDNTGLDPGWCVDRVMVRDLQTKTKYYFLVNSWLQVYPDDEDETCLETTVQVATEEELMNFSNIFGSQLSYGWEDAHIWLSVIERPTRSRFTRVQRVTCCVTLLLIFMLFSAMWYQGYDPDGDVIPQDTLIGIIRWKDIAVGAIVSLMVFPISLLFVCVFKKSKSKVAPVKPWLERSRTAQTIEILDEIVNGGSRRYPNDISDSEDGYDDNESKHHRGQLPGFTEYLNETEEGGMLFHSRAQTPVSNKSKVYEASSSRKSKLHKGSGTVKSLDIKSNVWAGELTHLASDNSSSSGVTGSTGDIGISSEERSSTSESPDWPTRTSATKKGLLHFQNDNELQKPVKFSSTSFTDMPSTVNQKPLRRRNTGYVRTTDSASPPNFVPDDDDGYGDFGDLFQDDDIDNIGDSLVISNRQAVLKRTSGTKFEEGDDIPYMEHERRGLVLDDVLVDQSDEDSDESDVPLPDFPTSRGESRMSRASTHFGTSPQPSDEKYLLPHWCIYANYLLCFVTMGVSIFFIILYGNAFGADTTKRWLLSTFVALLESFFIVEPVKVVLFAVFLAMITKPINPEENDNLVEEPLVETYGQNESFSKVRAPGGFALDKCKREAQKTKRSNKLLLNLAIYIIFLSSVAAVASWDRDTMGYYNTMAVKESLFAPNFNLTSDAEGPRWQNNSASFKEIRSVTDIWAWLDQVLAVKIFEDKSTLENQILNNYLLGKIRIRQQKNIPKNCILDEFGKRYNQLTYNGQMCLSNNAKLQQTATYGVGWSDDANGSWTWSEAEFGGVQYWSEDLIYDDSGYSQYLNGSYTVEDAQQVLSGLQSENWIDRDTRVVFVEFTQLNQATYWFTVTVVMFEMGVSGGVRPSYDIQTVRIIVPSTSFYVDMLFMSLVGIIGIILLLRELNKARDEKLTARLYFIKWTNWLNLTILALTVTLCVLYVYKEVYMEEVAQKYIADKTAFTNFYKIAFYTDLVTIMACLLLFALIARATRLFRFIKMWSSFGDTMVASAGYLCGAALMLMIFVLNFAILGYLVYGQSYTQIIPDFRDFPNAIYAMFRAFRGRLDVRICFDYSPFFTIFFFFSYFFGIFYIFCRLFAAILINEYKFTKGRKSRLRTQHVQDFDILKHLIARIKMRLGITKPKQYRPVVRFEGMSTPSSRGSFMSLDSFDTCFMPGRISECSYATGISTSSSDSGFGTPSDHSLSVFDYLTLDQPSDTPMDTKHLDYLYNRLSNYSVDMMQHRFERVDTLTKEVNDLEADAIETSKKKHQIEMLRNQSKEIAFAASSMTVRPHLVSEESLEKRSAGSSAYSSRGHFSMQSQQTLSQASLSSGRKSAISTDSRFQTVVQSMFPGMPDISKAELDTLRRGPVRSGSYTGPSQSQPKKSNVRGTISASTILKREGSNTSTSNKQGASSSTNSSKKRPHSDEGVRFSNQTSMITQDRQIHVSLNDLSARTTKQSSGRSSSPHPQKTDSKTQNTRPSPSSRPTKKSAWW